MKITRQQLLTMLLFACLLSAMVGALMGTLLTVDSEQYGPVDRLEYRQGSMCRVYTRDSVDIYICNNRLGVEQ